MRCEVCGREGARKAGEVRDWFLKTSERAFPVYVCVNCGSYFLFPRPKDKELKKAYPREYWWPSFVKGFGGRGKLMEGYRRVGARLMARWIETGGGGRRALRVVELGSGIGTVLAVGKKEFGWRVEGVDSSRDASRVARKYYGIGVRVADLEKRLPDMTSYDVVILSHVLEHLKDPEMFLKVVNKRTSGRVKLAVSVPNGGGLGRRVFGLGWRGFDIPRHLRVYTKKGLEEQLKSAGFKVESRLLFSFRDDAPHLAGSIVPGWDPVIMRVRGVDGWRFLFQAVGFGILVMLLQPVAYITGLIGWGETINLICQKSKVPLRRASNSQ